MPNPIRRPAEAATEPDATAPGSNTAPGVAGPAGPALGSSLGKYRLIRVLGQGGMGAVYLADDTKLGRQVAVKTMRPELAADPVAKERFLREARATAAIEHENVIPIFAVDEDGGIPYLVMPVLKGTSLADRIREDPPLTLAEVCRIGRETASGLAAAHARGLVHRDIKPANLWLDAGTNRVKILDFGLARPQLAAGENLTHSGAIIGTPAYMAPEQARGEPLDGRADLFSLGCVLYQLATGRRPFQGDSVMAILMALAGSTPSPASEVNPAVPADLSAFIEQLLAKNPAGRPTSAAVAAETLGQIQDGIAGGVGVRVVPSAQFPTSYGTMADAFANLDEDGPSEVTRSAARPPVKASKFPLFLLVGSGAAVLAGGIAAVFLLGPKAASTEPVESGRRGVSPPPPPTTKTPPKPNPRSGPLLDANDLWPVPQPALPGPFDRLDLTAIPAAERAGLPLPAEVAAVIGSRRGLCPSYGGSWAISPDGRWVARSNPNDSSGLTVWDAKTLDPVFQNTSGLQSLAIAISPDSKLVAVGITRLDGAHGVRLCDLAASPPRALKELAFRSENGTNHLAFAADGKTLVTGTGHGGVYLWDTTGVGDTPTRVLSEPNTGAPVYQIGVSADGRTVVASFQNDTERTVRVRGWDTTTGMAKFDLPFVEPGAWLRFALAPDGRRLVTLRSDGMSAPEVVCWDVTGAEPKQLQKYGRAEWIVTPAQGQRDIDLRREGRAERWRFGETTFEKINELPPGCLTLSPDGSRLVQWDAGRLRVRDDTNKVLAEGVEPVANQNYAPAAFGGRVLTTMNGPKFWAVKDGAFVATAVTGEAATAIAQHGMTLTQFSPDGRLVAGLGSDTVVYVYAVDGNTLRPAARLLSGNNANRAGYTLGFVWGPDSKTVAARQKDGSVVLYDVTKDPAEVQRLPEQTPYDNWLPMAFSPSGKRLAQLEYDGVVVWNLTGPKPALRRLAFETGSTAYGVGFSNDERYLIVGSYMPGGGETSCRVRRHDLTATDPSKFEEVLVGKFAHIRLSPDGRALMGLGGSGFEAWDAGPFKRRFAFRTPYLAGNNESYPAGWADDSRHFVLDAGGQVWVVRAGK